METVRSGDKVKAGVYVSPKAFDVKYVGAEGETLAGKEGTEYRKVPTPLFVIAGPILGGLFVLLFPLIMIAALVYSLVKFVNGPRRGAARLMLAALIVGACAMALPLLVHLSASIFAVAPFPKPAEESRMYTLYDFVTHVKGIEYLLALGAIAAFLLFWEFLKPAPFAWLKTETHADAEFVKENGGARFALINLGRIAMVPFVGLAYVAMLPVLFVAAMCLAAAQGLFLGGKRIVTLLGGHVSLDWRPLDHWFPRHA